MKRGLAILGGRQASSDWKEEPRFAESMAGSGWAMYLDGQRAISGGVGGCPSRSPPPPPLLDGLPYICYPPGANVPR
eukprot:scaffold8697_cov33-Tisochrysis_lutea.AAC.5